MASSALPIVATLLTSLTGPGGDVTARDEGRPVAADHLPRLVGRVIAADGTPVAEAPLEAWFRLERVDGEVGWIDGGAGVSASDGSFAFDLACVVPVGARCSLQLRQPEAERRPWCERISVPVELPESLAPRHALGDVRLRSTAVLAELAQLDDETLELLFESASAGARSSEVASLDVHRCASALVEHGGPRVISFFERQLREFDREEWCFDGDAPEGLADPFLLTALRRAQRRRDPLQLVAAATEPTVIPFGDPIEAALEVRNVDEERTPVGWRRWPSVPETALVGFRDPSGAAVASSIPNEVVILTGPLRDEVLSTDRLIATHVKRPWLDHRPLTGDFSVVVRQPLAPAPTYMLDLWRDVPWIEIATPPIALRVVPRPITLPAAERVRLRERFAAIDFAAPRRVAWATPAEGLEFEGAPKRAEDSLYRAGWSAVPVLLDALAETKGPCASPEAKAWALALLVSVTPLGLDVQGAGSMLDRADEALGQHRSVSPWPGVVRRSSGGVTIATAEEGRLDGSAPPDPRFQAELIERWRAVREALDVGE